MTREDVRQQLAKNPLWWEEAPDMFGNIRLVANLKAGELSIYFVIIYEYEIDEIKRAMLLLMASADRDEVGEILVRKVNNFPSPKELKAIAEAHRLNLTCRMLGITD